jgi:hypothetical protein
MVSFEKKTVATAKREGRGEEGGGPSTKLLDDSIDDQVILLTAREGNKKK